MVIILSMPADATNRASPRILRTCQLFNPSSRGSSPDTNPASMLAGRSCRVTLPQKGRIRGRPGNAGIAPATVRKSTRPGISKHSPNPDQTLIGEMVQNHKRPTSASPMHSPEVLQTGHPASKKSPPAVRRPWRKIQAGHYRIRETNAKPSGTNGRLPRRFRQSVSHPRQAHSSSLSLFMARRNARLTQRILPIKALIVRRSSRLRNAEGSSAGRRSRISPQMTLPIAIFRRPA